MLFAILNVVSNPPVLSVLGAHLLFNMKEAGEKGLNQGTNCGSKSIVTEMDFAAPPPVASSESQGEMMVHEIIEPEEVC